MQAQFRSHEGLWYREEGREMIRDDLGGGAISDYDWWEKRG